MKDKINEFRYIKNRILFFSAHREAALYRSWDHTLERPMPWV